MKRAAARLAALSALTALAACGGERRAEVPASAGPPAMSAAERTSLPGALAWVSERGGRRAVFLVPAAGGTPRPLAALPGGDMYPGPASGDGRTLSLVSARGEREDTHEEALWTLDLAAASARPERLVTSRRLRNPVFTADGTGILFEADLASFADLYRIALTGGAPARLTREHGGSFQPAIGPGGDVLFTSSRDGVAQVYRMAADGAAPRRLTASRAEDLAPLPAPTGELVAFISARDGRDRLYLMRPDGSGVRPMTHEPIPEADEQAPTWSPDGSRLAYLVRSAEETRLWVTEVATGARRPLGAPGHRDDQPVFSPDGRHVAFVSEQGGNADLYVVRADGGAVARITFHPAADWLPRWLPRAPPGR
jgi:TolB protein